MKALIYGRYSSHAQKDTSIEQQFDEIRHYCEANGIDIVGEYADRHMTGTNDNRPEFQRMMKDACKGHVQAVVVWKVDRFARNRYDSATHKARLKKHGVRVMYAKESIPDGPEGILLESVLEGSAEYYSANLSQNIKRGMMANANECKVNNGYPLGYCRGDDGRYAIDPIGAAIVQDVFSMFVDGMTTTDICNVLNAKGYRTSKGAKFNKNSLRVMLRNERYIGVYKYADVRIEGGMPVIISKEVFNMAQELIAKHAKSPSASSAVDYLLTGKLFCGKCGSPMVGDSGRSKTGKVHHYYACVKKKREHACDKKNVIKAWIEEIVVRETVQRVLVDSVVERIADSVIALQEKERESGEMQVMKQQLAETERLIKNVMSAIEHGIITATTKDRLLELEDRKAELENAIEQASMYSPKLTREHIIFWLNKLKNGDVTDPAFQAKIIENFVNAIYLYDDKLRIVYNYTKNGAETVDLDFVDGVSSGNGFGVDAFGSTNTHQAELFVYLDVFVLTVSLPISG